MSENSTVLEIENVESTELDLAEVVRELVDLTFGSDQIVTPYKVATIINKVFKATLTPKQIPTQMMYTYDRNGLIVKGKKGIKEYNKDEVATFVLKYTSKHVNV